MLLFLRCRREQMILILAIIIAQVVGPIKAFIPDRLYGVSAPLGEYHSTITQDALESVARQYFNDQRAPGDRLITSNMPFLMFQQFYQGSVSAQDFENIVDEIETVNAQVDKNENTKDNPAWHFDAERFEQANLKVVEHFERTITLINGRNFDSARQQLRILHTLQDFYSHSNWIEMGHSQPNPSIGVRGASLGVLSPPNEATCTNCSRTTVDRALSGLLRVLSGNGALLKLIHGHPDRIYRCENNLVENLKLTSGYYSNQVDDAGQAVLKPRNVAKCSHGGVLDATSSDPPLGGINKDSHNGALSPHENLHEKAAAVARQATVDYLNRIRTAVGNDLFGRFLQLSPGTSFALVIDVTESMKPYYGKIRQLLENLSRRSKSEATKKVDLYILVPFDDTFAGPAYYTDNFEELLQMYDRMAALNVTSTSSLNSSSLQWQMFEAALIAARHSMVGGRVAVAANTQATSSEARAAFDVLRDFAFRKQLSIEINFTPEAIMEFRRKKRSDSLLDERLFHAAFGAGGRLMVATAEDTNDTTPGDAAEVYDDVLPSTVVLLKRIYTDEPYVAQLQVHELMKTVTIYVTALGGSTPKVLVRGINGWSPLVNVAMISGGQVLEIRNISESGLLQLTVDGVDGPYGIDITAQEGWTLAWRLHDEVKNSPHPGTHPIEGKPLANSQLILEIRADVAQHGSAIPALQFLSLSDEVLAWYNLTRALGRRENVFVAAVTVPMQPFFVALQVRSHNDAADTVSYLSPRLIESSTVMVTARRVSRKHRLITVEFNVTNFGAADIFDITALHSKPGCMRQYKPSASRISVPTGASTTHSSRVLLNAECDDLDAEVYIIASGERDESRNFAKC